MITLADIEAAALRLVRNSQAHPPRAASGCLQSCKTRYLGQGRTAPAHRAHTRFEAPTTSSSSSPDRHESWRLRPAITLRAWPWPRTSPAGAVRCSCRPRLQFRRSRPPKATGPPSTWSMAISRTALPSPDKRPWPTRPPSCPPSTTRPSSPGQGTIGLELAASMPEEIETVVVPIGGGGLITGVAVALKTLRPEYSHRRRRSGRGTDHEPSPCVKVARSDLKRQRPWPTALPCAKCLS